MFQFLTEWPIARGPMSRKARVFSLSNSFMHGISPVTDDDQQMSRRPTSPDLPLMILQKIQEAMAPTRSSKKGNCCIDGCSDRASTGIMRGVCITNRPFPTHANACRGNSGAHNYSPKRHFLSTVPASGTPDLTLKQQRNQSVSISLPTLGPSLVPGFAQSCYIAVDFSGIERCLWLVSDVVYLAM